MGENTPAPKGNAPTIIAGVIVALAIVASAILVYARPGGAGAAAGVDQGPLVVLVHDGDGQTRELPLDVDGSYPIETELGSNTIIVEGGRVWISEADCPNGDCLRQNPLEEPGPQLICLPHRLWVEIAPAGSEGSGLDEESVSPTPEDIDVVAR